MIDDSDAVEALCERGQGDATGRLLCSQLSNSWFDHACSKIVKAIVLAGEFKPLSKGFELQNQKAFILYHFPSTAKSFCACMNQRKKTPASDRSAPR